MLKPMCAFAAELPSAYVSLRVVCTQDKGLATGLQEQYEGCPQLEVQPRRFRTNRLVYQGVLQLTIRGCCGGPIR